jgi:hypothetical protein
MGRGKIPIQGYKEVCSRIYLLAQRHTQGSAPRAHQQALATGPFGSACEADAFSPEAAMRGLQDRDVYNQRNIKWFSLQQQHNMHLSFK